MKYTLNLYREDMGTFTQPGCNGIEDALWHINDARDHDGLPHIGMDDLKDMLNCPNSNCNRATLEPEN